MKKISEDFSGDFEVMRVLTFEPRLCTLHELYEVYSLDQFYDFIEIIDVQESLKEIATNQNKQPQVKRK